MKEYFQDNHGTGLYILESRDDSKVLFEDENVLVTSIPEELDNIDSSEYSYIKEQMLGLKTETRFSFPAFYTMWRKIGFSWNAGLIEKSLVYKSLIDKINSNNIDYVIFDFQTDEYSSVMRDIERDTNAEVKGLIDNDSRLRDILKMIRNEIDEISSFAISIVDQLLGNLLCESNGLGSKYENADNIVIPYPGRDESLKPIIKNIDTSCILLLDARSSAPNLFGYHYPGDWDDFDHTYFREFVSPSTIKRQTELFFNFYLEKYVYKNIEREVSSCLQDTLGCAPELTVRDAVHTSFQNRLLEFSKAVIADELFADLDSCNAVITGSNGTMYKPIRHFGRQHNIDQYYVPHTIAHPVELEDPPLPGTTMFVAGDFDKQYMEKEYYSSCPNLISLGRPYFRERFPDDINIYQEVDEENVKLTVATQKIERCRKEFVTDILLVADKSTNISDVVIKIHPVETVDYYQSIISDLDIGTNVTVEDDRLRHHLQNADIVLTINSNVGLESMVVGTPVVSYNKWCPFIPSFPYATEGPGILIESRSDLREFIESLSKEKIRSLSEECYTFSRSNFYPASEAAQEIARHIEDGS